LPFLIWGAACWLDFGSNPGRWGKGVLSGLLLSAAVFMKTPAVLVPFTLLACRFFRGGEPRPWGARVRELFPMLAGLVGPPLVAAIYYALRGAWTPMVDALFIFGPKYAREYGTSSFGYHSARIVWMFDFILPTGMGFLILAGLVRGCLIRSRLVQAWVWACAIMLVQVVMQGKYFLYHALVMLPVVALGCGLAWVPAGTGPDAIPEGRMATLLRHCASLLICIVIMAAGWRIREPWADLFRPPEHRVAHEGRCLTYHTESVRLAGEIRKRTQPNDRVFMWANSALPYFLSDRRMAGPYSQVFLVAAPWLGEERVLQLIYRLDRERPKLFIIGRRDLVCIPKDSRQLFEEFGSVRDFLVSRYVKDADFDGFEIWRRLE
jgi:hypothetical protein